MLRFVILAIAILFDPAIAPAAEMSGCNQLSQLSSARLRWAAARIKSRTITLFIRKRAVSPIARTTSRQC